MNDLLTYELINFLPFSVDVYERLFVRLNEAAWPAQLLAVVLLGGIAWAIQRGSSRVTLALTAVSWISVAWFFFAEQFSTLLWAAPYIGAAFVLQGLLMVGASPRVEVAAPRTAIAALIAVAVLWPTWRVVSGQPWEAFEVFGLAPDVTALVTLALLSGFGRRAWPLLLLPLFWCVISAATWWALGVSSGWVTAVIGALLCLFVLRRETVS